MADPSSANPFPTFLACRHPYWRIVEGCPLPIGRVKYFQDHCSDMSSSMSPSLSATSFPHAREAHQLGPTASSVQVRPASSSLTSFFGTLVLHPTAVIDVHSDAGPVFGQVHQYRYGVRFAQHRHAVGFLHHFLLYSITMKAARMAAMTAAAAHAATVAVSSSSAS